MKNSKIYSKVAILLFSVLFLSGEVYAAKCKIKIQVKNNYSETTTLYNLKAYAHATEKVQKRFRKKSSEGLFRYAKIGGFKTPSLWDNKFNRKYSIAAHRFNLKKPVILKPGQTKTFTTNMSVKSNIKYPVTIAYQWANSTSKRGDAVGILATDYPYCRMGTYSLNLVNVLDKF